MANMRYGPHAVAISVIMVAIVLRMRAHGLIRVWLIITKIGRDERASRLHDNGTDAQLAYEIGGRGQSIQHHSAPSPFPVVTCKFDCCGSYGGVIFCRNWPNAVLIFLCSNISVTSLFY